MKIDVYKNEIDTYFEFERNKYGVDETDNIITPNTSWFLLKPSMTDEKMNKYKLSPGEILKIGRITMRIRDIIFDGKNKYNMDESLILNESMVSKENINEMHTLKTEGEGKRLLLGINKKIKTYRNKRKDFDENDTGFDKKEKIKSLKKKDFKKSLNHLSKLEKKNKICRICYIQEEDEENNPLVQPCICDGSLKYIHLQCLSQWVHTHSCEKLETNNNCSIYLIKPIQCELCKTKFPDYIKFKSKFFPLINFTKEYKSYLTLESLTLDKHRNKFIYVVSLDKSGKIALGKNYNCQIVLSDRSIENVHCFMVVSNKQVYLEDNDSKFGTLVLVQTRRIKLYQDIPLYLQIGRSFLEILVKKDFKLFDCCVSDEKSNIYSYYEQNEKYIKNNMGLIVKDEDEESESFIKNNNTQEVKLYDYNNNSMSLGKDKMSDNEYLLIKRIKNNKNMKKSVYNELTIVQPEKKQNDENSNGNLKQPDDENEHNINQDNKQNDEYSEEIKIENDNESNEDNNQAMEEIYNNENDNKEENKNESKILEENKNKDEKSIIADKKSLDEDNKKEINEVESNINIPNDLNNNIIKYLNERDGSNKENEIIDLNESKNN